MRKITLLIVCLFAISAQAFSQGKTGKLSGTILDAAGKPAQGISVSLQKAADTSLVKVALSGKDGKYEFENPQNSSQDL